MQWRSSPDGVRTPPAGVRGPGWRPGRSVRSRLMLSILAMSALALALAGGTVGVVQWAGIDAAADDSLRRGYQEFERRSQGTDPDTGLPFAAVEPLLVAAMRYRVPGPYESQFALVDGRPFGYSGGTRPVELEHEPAALAAIEGVPADAGVTVRDVATSVGTVRLAIIPVRVAGQPTSGTFVIARTVGAERAGLARSGLLYLGLGTLSLLVIGLVGWQVSGGLVRPLSLLRDATSHTSATDLGSRIPVTGNDDIADLTDNFNAMLDRLEESFLAQRQLLDDVGHELRTPITVIRGHLEVLDAHDPAAVAATRALLLDETDRMNRLVEDLILLARVRQPDFVRPEPAELADVTDDAFAKARALGPRCWLLEEAGDATVRIDSQRLTQAWLQLAENAVKYSEPGSTIRMGSAVADGWVRFRVRDEGPGVPPAEQDRIFERFVRLDRTSGVEGTGLGLTIVQAVARAHGGRVELASAPGAGSTFSIVVPTGTSAAGTEEP